MSVAPRLALLYIALFMVIGVQMPFWPLWLSQRGMGPAEVGALLAAVYWARVVSNPAVAHLVDRWGRRRTVMRLLAVGAALVMPLFALADGFWAILAVAVIGGALQAGLMPLAETATMAHTLRGELDYGRVRLWGSLSFIVLATASGALVETLGAETILTLLLAGVWLSAAATWLLPPDAAPVPAAPRPAPEALPLPFRRLLADRPYMLFLLAASLTQGGHAVYYGFATLHWRAQGLGDGTIGILWAVGVIAEVALFAVSGAVVRRVGAARLLVIGAAAGLVRWTALAFAAPEPWLLIPLQTLHALTFGATHLAAMHIIAHTVDPRLAARAQALYSSIAMGVVQGLAVWAAGGAFTALGGLAYLLMSLAAGAATAVALLHWRAATAEGVNSPTPAAPRWSKPDAGPGSD